MDNLSSQSTRIFKTGYVLNDKWVIIEFIGKGAMGEVYRAHQLNLKRDVAIKVISQEMLESFEDDPKEIEMALHRFRREVQAMARVRHNNVLQIFDYGSENLHKDGRYIPMEYIAMEYIPGATLRFSMSEEGFFPEQHLIAAWLSDYFIPLLEGVKAIHAKDIAHRDLKPENVLMDGKIPKIADFGIACSLCLKPVTQSLDVKGTPAYMSPEHFFDFKNANQQSDIYSLGKILYEAIEGKITSKVLPFKDASLATPDTPFFKKLDRIIQNATAEKKEERFKSVGDLQIAILEALNILKTQSPPDRPITPKPIPLLYQPRFIWTGIVIAVLSMAGMGLWHLVVEPGKKKALLKKPETTKIMLASPGSDAPLTPETVKPESPEPSILGKDGMILHLIPDGKFKTKIKDSKYEGQIISISPFYMDEKMVTNHHFAVFLNEMKNRVVVENGIVKNNNEIWFYLGEGESSHEQIIYEHGRFHLRDTQFAASPVARVTWYGASAYARHYGKRLLTVFEWEYAVYNRMMPSKNTSGEKADKPQTNNVKASSNSNMHTHRMHMNDTFGPGKSQSKTSVSKASEKKFKEWVIQYHSGDKNLNETGSKKNISYPSLVVAASQYPSKPFKNFRYPWEAFPNVGFRCAISLGNEH